MARVHRPSSAGHRELRRRTSVRTNPQNLRVSAVDGLPGIVDRLAKTVTSRSCAGSGSGRKSTAHTALNIVVVAPMPSASVRITSVEKPRLRDRFRQAKCRSMTVDTARRWPQEGRFSFHYRERSRLSRPALGSACPNLEARRYQSNVTRWVTLTFASWNQIGEWMRQLDAFRQAA